MTENPEITITPTLAQYRALCANLETLRPATKAMTNTTVICEAVAREAAKVRRERMRAA